MRGVFRSQVPPCRAAPACAGQQLPAWGVMHLPDPSLAPAAGHCSLGDVGFSSNSVKVSTLQNTLFSLFVKF